MSSGKRMPEISVIMSVYNCANTLSDAIESILSQSFKDFEFLITDDCSQDSTVNVLRTYAKEDKRIRLFFNENNMGLAANLNFMLGKAEGIYSVRMDGDDVSLPERLYEQFSFMEDNPDTDVCGSLAEMFDETGKLHDVKLPELHNDIEAHFIFKNVILHPTVMFRMSSLKKHSVYYDEKFRYMQDYELWIRFADSLKYYNLQKVLLKYRINAKGTTALSSSKKEEREKSYLKILKPLYSELNISLLNEKAALFFNSPQYIGTENELEEIVSWYKSLEIQNKKLSIFDSQSFEKVLSEYLFIIFRRSAHLGLKSFLTYTATDFNKSYIPLCHKIKFLIKCFLKKRDEK
jgi:glycosyltransferase involved in cell wall biosynthesis